MRDRKKAEEIATERLQLLLPLLAEGLDSARARQLRGQICTRAGISERTLRRYLARYQAQGFDGLKPKQKSLLYKPHTAPGPLLSNSHIVCDREDPRAQRGSDYTPKFPPTDGRAARRADQTQHPAGETRPKGLQQHRQKDG